MCKSLSLRVSLSLSLTYTHTLSLPPRALIHIQILIGSTCLLSPFQYSFEQSHVQLSLLSYEAGQTNTWDLLHLFILNMGVASCLPFPSRVLQQPPLHALCWTSSWSLISPCTSCMACRSRLVPRPSPSWVCRGDGEGGRKLTELKEEVGLAIWGPSEVCVCGGSTW